MGEIYIQDDDGTVTRADGQPMTDTDQARIDAVRDALREEGR